MARAKGSSPKAHKRCSELNEPHLWHSDILALRSGDVPFEVDWCVKCGQDRAPGAIRRAKAKWRHVETVRVKGEAL